MKILKAIPVFLLLFCLLGVTSFAYSEPNDFFGELGNSAPEGTFDFESPEQLTDGVGIEALLGNFVSALRGGASDAASFFLLLFGIGILLAVSDGVSLIASKSFSQGTGICVSLVSSVMIFSRMSRVVFSVAESIEELNSFFSAAVPVFSGLLAASGNVQSAGVQAVNMSLTLSILGELTAKFLIPTVFSLFAFSLLSGLSDSGVSSIARGIKSFFNWGLGIISAVIIGAFSLQSVIATASDSAYLRAAKYAAAGLIPVVGSTVSGALSSLAGGLSYIKSVVGVGGVLIILSVSLVPLVTLLLYRAAVSLCISMLEFIGCDGGVRIFTAFRSAHDALISVYVVTSIIYISEIMIFMRSGVEMFG